MSPHRRSMPRLGHGLSFGPVADRYERYRLGYPEEIVDTVLKYAGRPVRTALEVGAGTGKATRLFASRGIEVTALEPDAAMAQVLRRMVVELPVRPIVSTFEAYDAHHRFDLVYAAAAWHWTDPATRWTRVVDMLVPGGTVALFGRPSDLHDRELCAAVEQIEQDIMPDDVSVTRHWSIAEMAATDGLTDAVERAMPSVVVMSADDFVGRLSTVSAYLMLSEPARADALRRVRAVLPDPVEVDATVRLSLGRRQR